MVKTHRIKPIGRSSILLFVMVIVTGLWTAAGAQALFFDNPIRSAVLFAVAILHFLLADWYFCFTQHWTRWFTLAVLVIAVASFSQMCYTDYMQSAHEVNQLHAHMLQVLLRM